MSERLLRDRDVAAMLGTTPGVAVSILTARGVCAIDLGRGRSRGRRWLESAVRQMLMEMHAEAQPRKRKGAVRPPARETASASVASMSVRELYELLTPAGCVQ